MKNIKALAGALNDQNRHECAANTKPLMEAVDDLVKFASAAEFVSIRAEISAEVSVDCVVNFEFFSDKVDLLNVVIILVD